MNKLCCIVSPIGTCEGCGMKWCETCQDKTRWDSDAAHGAILSYTPLVTVAKWKCPVARVVTFKYDVPVNDINKMVDGPWTFVPYVEK
jgi:hypothetical protein